MTPTISGPSEWPASSEPPTFDIFTGGAPYWMAELATSPNLMTSEESASRTPDNYFLGSDAENVFSSDANWTVPQDVWDRLGLSGRLYYRVYTSTSNSDWVDWEGSAADDDWASFGVLTIGSSGDPSVSSSFTSADPDGDVAALCRYLGITVDAFSAEQDRYFGRLGELLTFHSVVSAADEIDAKTFREAVRSFQRGNGLGDDGIPGEDTLWALNSTWAEARNLSLVRVDADLWTPPGVSTHIEDQYGYSSLNVRSDVSDAVIGLRADLNAAGVLMTTAGGARPLNAPVTPGRSATSIHYSACAFDLATVSGMATTASANATNQLYVITSDGGRWNVWARSDSGTQQTLQAVEWSGGATTTREVEGSFVDVTAMAAARGFATIGPRDSFPGNYLSAEWWHLQSSEALIPWISQFGAEIVSLDVYSLADLEAQDPVWVNRKKIFHKASNGWW